MPGMQHVLLPEADNRDTSPCPLVVSWPGERDALPGSVCLQAPQLLRDLFSVETSQVRKMMEANIAEVGKALQPCPLR